jgi:hypothetical protein
MANGCSSSALCTHWIGQQQPIFIGRWVFGTASHSLFGHMFICSQEALSELMWALAIVVGSLDALTTAWGLLEIARSLGLAPGAGTMVACVILAEIIAVLPEPLIVALAIVLVRLLRK